MRLLETGSIPHYPTRRSQLLLNCMGCALGRPQEPQDRGDPLVIQTTGSSDLAASVQKAACIQAMCDREPSRKSPMQAPTDPACLTPLIQGLPDTLKIFAAKVQDCLQAAHALNNTNTSCGWAPGQQSPVTSS